MALNDPQEQNPAADDKSFADILNEFESSTKPVQKEAAKSGGKGRAAEGVPAQRDCREP